MDRTKPGIIIIIVFLSVMLVFSLIMMAEEPIENGEIIDKTHVPAYHTMILMPIGHGLIPCTMYHDDQYLITIEGTTPSGKRKTRVIETSEDEYNKLEVGDKWEDEHE